MSEKNSFVRKKVVIFYAYFLSVYFVYSCSHKYYTILQGQNLSLTNHSSFTFTETKDNFPFSIVFIRVLIEFHQALCQIRLDSKNTLKYFIYYYVPIYIFFKYSLQSHLKDNAEDISKLAMTNL